MRLGCTRQTIDNYINENEEIRMIYEEQRDVIVDIAESKWLQKINEGSWDAIKFALMTLGNDRGYNLPTKIAPTDPTGEKPYQIMDDNELEKRLVAIVNGSTEKFADPDSKD